MTTIKTDTARERAIERHVMGRILSATGADACGRDLVILAGSCPPPLHRWFTDPICRALAVAADDALAGKIPATADAITEKVSSFSHSDCLDSFKDRQIDSKPCSYEDSALANYGGWSEIAELRAATVDFVGGQGVERNAPSLRHAGDRRRAIEDLRIAAAAIAASDLHNGPYEAIGQHRERLLSLIAGGNADRNLGDYLHTALRAGEAFAALRDRGQTLTATWGLPELDGLVPLRPGGLYVLAAAPGAGKTSLALMAAAATAKAGGQGAVALTSLEMTGSELAAIIAGRQVGISPAAIREHSASVPLEAWERLEALTASWRDSSSLLVRDAAASNHQTTVDGFTSWLGQRAAAAPRMALAVLDYLQLLDGSNARQNEYERITAATRAIKRAAVGLSLPILVLSQMNRAGRAQIKDRGGKVTGDPEPTLADLRGSGSIEQDADAVIFLHALGVPDPAARAIKVRATVAKNRGGAQGSIDLWFHRRQQLFEFAPENAGTNHAEATVRRTKIASPPHADEMKTFG